MLWCFFVYYLYSGWCFLVGVVGSGVVEDKIINNIFFVGSGGGVVVVVWLVFFI